MLRVAGKIETDSLTVTGGTHIFGKLHIGNNSLILGGALIQVVMTK